MLAATVVGAVGVINVARAENNNNIVLSSMNGNNSNSDYKYNYIVDGHNRYSKNLGKNSSSVRLSSLKLDEPQYKVEEAEKYKTMELKKSKDNDISSGIELSSTHNNNDNTTPYNDKKAKGDGKVILSSMKKENASNLMANMAENKINEPKKTTDEEEKKKIVDEALEKIKKMKYLTEEQKKILSTYSMDIHLEINLLMK